MQDVDSIDNQITGILSVQVSFTLRADYLGNMQGLSFFLLLTIVTTVTAQSGI